MSGLILPAWYTRQPDFAAQIETKNPLSNGLVVATYGGNWKNLANSDAFSAFNSPTVDVGPSGKSTRFIQASSQYLKKSSQGISGFPFTVVQLINRNSASEATGYFCLGAASGGERFLLYSASNAQFTLFASTSGGSTSTSITTSMVAKTDYVIGAVVASATDRRVYLNGRQEGSSAVSRAPGTLSVMTIGSDWSSGAAGIFHNGAISLTLVWNRALSDYEMALLARDIRRSPWQLVKAPTRRLWIGASTGGGSTYNVDAADSITSTDAATQQLTAPAAATDAATATDSATNLGVLTRSASDAAAATDTASNALTIAASTTDAASATDSATSASAVNSAATDAISATDAATQLAGLPAAVSDSVSAADAASNVATMAAAATDAATATDSATGLRITTAAATDAATATDSASQVNAVNVAASDAISAADAATVQAVIAGIVSDGFSTVDAATLLAGIYNVTAADVLSLLDLAAADGGVQYTRAPAGWAQPLIEPTGHRAPVISGSRPGNINTSRPANRGGRRT